MEISIRMARETDAEALLNIYTPYVLNTAVTFEYEVPSAEEFSRRIQSTLQKYPYLVGIENGVIFGYAYASTFKARAAYDWAVETSIYLKGDHRGQGLGKMLYLALEDMLRRQNILNLNACIAFGSDKDPHFDSASALFHAHLGYTQAAHFTKCGYKFGTWYDMIWMEKLLGEHPANPKPVIPAAML